MGTHFDNTSFLYGTNSAFIEELYARYLETPNSVDPSWRAVFDDLGDEAPNVMKAARGAPWARRDWPERLDGGLVNGARVEPRGVQGLAEAPSAAAGAREIRAATLDSIRALMMIRAYRVRGHLIAKLDPLGLEGRAEHPELAPESYGFTEADLDRPIFIDNVLGLESATLREILEILKRTYCATIGVEFMHISDPGEKAWIQERIEGREKEVRFTLEGKRAILQKIIEAEEFERFLSRKYTGTKRFGLEGGEALIPAMEAVIKTGGQLGVKELVLGMAHRGRLNVLATVMGKSLQAIFAEFQGGSSTPEDVQGSGDVKYHLGTSSDRSFDGNEVHLSLTGNPSHLEAVNPVVLGKARAKQTQRGDTERRAVLSVLLHGDAAFAGQGLVAECFGMSDLKGHRTGGTVHIIINNQIGFTTAPKHSRSSPYPSDVAKMVQAPIFHVNGDDPEAVVHVAKIATEFRQAFKKDVVVDMFCYRRFGHNEADEPAFTQPLMYRAIAEHPTVREIYGKRLVEDGVVSGRDLEEMATHIRGTLDAAFEASTSYKANKADWLDGKWSGFKVARGDVRRGDTDAPMRTLKDVGEALTTVPESFNLHRTLRRILGQKREMLEAGENVDWATAEALAFGTLLCEGYNVRLSGQDSGRGTFSQRHAVFIDQKSEEPFVPLNNLASEGRGTFEVVDTMLSEAAILGFEYGYSTADPNTLVLWEAQFGDFANGAQMIIDQFVSSAESKWLRMSGLVMLLPHGYEGQGPEHSSARLERYLQLCAEDNIQVANCTTPANYFHILRRQLHRNFRKPLIIMTPKSLLRHKRAVSYLSDMGPGTSFHRLFQDHAEFYPGSSVELVPDAKMRRVILCSGKVYYDLFEEREKRNMTDVILFRLEQLYPFPRRPLIRELARFRNAKVIWCQEEPQNMGAWTFVEPRIEDILVKLGYKNARPIYAGRAAAASTATGLMRTHQREQAALVDEALGSRRD